MLELEQSLCSDHHTGCFYVFLCCSVMREGLKINLEWTYLNIFYLINIWKWYWEKESGAERKKLNISLLLSTIIFLNVFFSINVEISIFSLLIQIYIRSYSYLCVYHKLYSELCQSLIKIQVTYVIGMDKSQQLSCVWMF